MIDNQKSVIKGDIPLLDEAIKYLKGYYSLDSKLFLSPCTTCLDFREGAYRGERTICLDNIFYIKQEGKSLEDKITFGSFVSDFSLLVERKDKSIEAPHSLKQELANKPIQAMEFKTQFPSDGSNYNIDGKVLLYFEKYCQGAQLVLGELREDFFEYLAPSNFTIFLQKLQTSLFDFSSFYFVPGLCRLKHLSEKLQEIGNGIVQKEKEGTYQQFPSYYNYLTKMQRDFVPEKTAVLYNGVEVPYDGEINLHDLSIYLRLERIYEKIPSDLENAEKALELIPQAEEVVDITNKLQKRLILENNGELEMDESTYEFLISEEGKQIVGELRAKYEQQKQIYKQLLENAKGLLKNGT